VHNSLQFDLLMFGTGYPRIVTADTVASFVKGINSLGAHFLVPDFDCSDCSFFSLFLLRAAISAFHNLAVPPS